MLDLGQPNHAYDLDALGGAGVLVRRGQPGETLVTLDEVERFLQADDCVICDAVGTPVGVGGIMGASRAEIGPNTRRVLLEAAWFAPMAIARTGARLGLHSEARVRFERGVDPEIAVAAVDRFVALLGAVGPGLRRGPTVDVRDAALPTPATVQVRTARVNAILGTTLGDAEVADLLTPIGLAATPEADGVNAVRIPSWRLDAQREIDVVEEVARMWGYRRIPRTIPPGAPGGSGGLTSRQRDVRRIRDILAGAGFDEAWTTTFLAPGDLERAGLDPAAVEVQNPLDQSESLLRTALLPGLLKAVKFNADRQAEQVSLFEIGRVFARPSGDDILPDETDQLGVIVAPTLGGDASALGERAAAAAVRTWQYLAGALRLEASGLAPAAVAGWHPARAAHVMGAGREPLGAVGEIDPDVGHAYGLRHRLGYLTLSVDALLQQPRLPRRAGAVSRFPASDMDLAFLVPESISAGAVRATLQAHGGEVLEAVWLFDVYRGEQVGPGRRSLAFRLRFRAVDHTLSDTELAAARRRAIEAVVSAHGGELRA
jgi:phenylalanyl-tRNA synthetase beta chain